MSRPPWGTGLLVGLLAGGVALGSVVSQPAAGRPAGSLVDVVGATAVCPDLRQANNLLATRVSVGVAPLPTGRGGSTAAVGTVEALAVAQSGAPQAVAVAAPGQVDAGLGTTLNDDGLVVSATGVLAAGLEVEQVTRGERGIDRGLAGLRCDAPRTDAWFVGGATLVGDATLLMLVNVDDTPATVDVNVFTAKGPADSRPGQGITVAPHTRLGIRLDSIAPDRGLLAVHVLSRRGRVAAGMRHARAAGGIPLGADWVPQATPPATKVVIPGIPEGPGIRTVMVSNPGLDDTVVSVQVTTADGQFVPTDLAAIAVPAGTTIARRVDTLTADSALAVSVTSVGGPVVAGALIVDSQTGPVREIAYTAGSLPLSGPALLTDLVLNRPTESTLILTAPDQKATVVVTPIRVVGTKGTLPAAKTVTIPAGRTVTLKLSTFYPPGTETRLAVSVQPADGSGQVYASRYLRERGANGPLTTVLDLQGPAQRVDQPVVVRDPMVGAGN